MNWMKMDISGLTGRFSHIRVRSPTRTKSTKAVVTMSLLNGRMVMSAKSL